MYITMVEDKPISYQESATEYNTLASSKMDPIYSGEHCEASSEYVTAIYSYMPQHSDEINLRTGQKIKILSKDCRHSGAEGWWVGQELKTGYVGVFPSGYVLNADDIANSESSGANEMKANSFEPNKWNDVTFGIGNNTDKTITVKTKEEISLDKKLPDSDVILRHSHVRTIPATELVQQQFIGSGAFGKVYRGLWREQDIALKVFDLATNQVDNEALHLCRLSHRNIVRFYGICRLDSSNFPALVMEYAYGGSLNMVLNQRPLLGPLVLLDWALQIASGMAYLHTDARICHRDLKSSNILIREAIQKPFSLNELQRCTLLITDFGMACRSSQLAPQQSKLGTVAYAAPEVCRQEGFSFKSDIWSYGVVLWELLTLDIPFRAMEQPRLLFIIAMYNYTLYIPPGVPDLFVQLLKDCWSPTPVSRPKFENIMARLKSCKDCSFVDLEPSELAQIQQDWRELIAVHYKEEQQTVAEALSSSFKSGSLDFSTELLTQLEMLRDYRESLDRVRADLVEKAHQLHIKEELYNRVADTMGQHFMFLAVLAANHFKDPTHKIQTAQPKPPPPRKRPFVRSIFKRWGTNGNPCSTHNDYVNSATSSTNNFQVKDLKRSINSSQYTSNNRSYLNVNTNNSSDLNNSFCDETQSILRDTSSRVGCSQGGIPLISPPTDMKHVVHVDSDWFTGQGLCESTMRLFPSAKITSSSLGSNTDKYRNMSPGHCYSPQIRTFVSTKSDSNMTDKSNPKSPRIYSSGNNITDLRSRDQRFVDVQTNSQRNLNRLPRKQNFIRKFESKNNLDFLQKSSNHSVGFSNFFTPINSCCYDTNNDLHRSEHSQSGYHHCRPIKPIIGIDNRMRNNNSPPFFERRRSASGPVTFFTRYPKINDQLKSNPDESLLEGKLNELLCIICDPSMPLLASGCTQHYYGRSLSTTTPPTACFSSDITESSYFLNPTGNSTVENVLLSAFRLLASFCFWGVEPDIDDRKANSVIPLYSTPRSSHNFGKIYPVSYYTSQSSQSYSRQKNSVRNAANSSLLFGHSESDFQHVFSSNSVCPIEKRKYKFSIQNTRRIQSADRRRNYKYNTSLKCPVCVNMGLDFIHPCEKFPDHQVEYGDPHSPFLGMLAGSGRRPNPSPNMKEINHSNFPIIPSNEMISSDKRVNYFTFQHDNFLKDINQKIGGQQQCKQNKRSDNSNNNSQQYTNCSLCNNNQMEIVEKNESTGNLNNAFYCPHLSVCIDYCQNNTRNNDIDVATIKTTLPYIPSSHLAQRWSFEHSKELHKDICSSFCSFLSCRKLSIDCQSSMISDCLRSVDKHSVSESSGHSIERNSTNQFSHSLVSMNPVGMSRDAYLKATQDGFLNRTIYEPSEDPEFCYSPYSNQTSQSNSLQRSSDNQSFSNSGVYPNVHALFIENDSKSESGSEFESYDDANELDYPNFILHSSSSPPKHSQQPQNFYSPSKIHLNDSDKPSENNDYSHNLNVNIDTCREDYDRVTLVPVESGELSNVIQPYSDNEGKGEPLAEYYNGNSTTKMTVKRVLHRSQAIRERHRPTFLTLFRNRSLPSCVDSDRSCLESCSFVLYPSDNGVDEVSDFPHKAKSSKSPSGPFVSLHSTFI